MSRFILTAQLRLRPPKNLNQVASQIQSRLNNIQANVKVNIPPKAQQQLAKTNNTLSKTSKSAESATNHITKFGEQAALAGKRFFAFTVATTAFLKLTRAISEGTSEAIDFQREMVRVSQVTDKTLGSLQGLSSEITNLSTSLGVQSKELLQSSRILSQAGLSADQVTTSLEALARSDLSPTFGSMNDTTEASVAIFRQFGIEAQDLEKSLGSINAVASKFAVESGDISTAVRRTGGAFSAAGGSLEELIALFTSVRATTRESAQSIATGFRTIFTRMQRESTQKFLESFGVTLRDLEGQFVGPLEAVRRLSTALDGLESTDPRFAKIVEQLGGFRQVSKVIPLIQQFATAEDALGVAIGGTNSLMEDSEKAQQSLAVQIQKTREEFSAMIRTLAGTDSFRAVVTLTLGMADAFIKVTEALEPLMPLLTTFAAMKVGQMAPLLMKGFKGKGGLGFASGGLVPGSGNQDSVPARLTPGEFVIRKDSVNRIGLGNLQSLNKMADGGRVPAQNPLGVVFADPNSKSRISSQVKPDNVEKSLKNLGLNLRDDQQVELDQGDYLEYNWITGRLDKDRSKLVKDTSKRAIESATLNIGKKINRQLPKDSQISKLRELDIIPNLDAMIGAVFEGTVMRLGAPFDTGQGDQSEHNRTLDFPNGLGGAGQKLFSNSALDGNIPVEAKKSLSTQSDLKGKNVRSNLRNKATNYVARNIFNSPDREFEGFRITTKSQGQGKPKPQARGGPAAPNALLTPGEFVFDKSAAQQIGTSNLNKMNKTGTLPGFNRGGGFQMGGGMGQFASAGFAMAGVSALVSNFKGLNDTVDNLLSTLTSFGSQMGILVIALRSLNQGVTSRMIGSIQRTPPTSLLPSTVQQQQNLGTLVPQLQSGQKQITTITKLNDQRKEAINQTQKMSNSMNKSILAIAAFSAALNVVGSYLEKIGRTQIEEGGGVGTFVGGKAASGAATGLQFGGAAGGFAGMLGGPFAALTVPVGAAIGGGIGAAAGGIAGGITGYGEGINIGLLSEFNSSLEDTNRKFEAINDGLTTFDQSMVSIQSHIRGTVRTLTDPDLSAEGRQDIMAGVQGQINNFRAFLKSAAKSSDDFAGMMDQVGEDVFNVLSDWMKVPRHEFRQQYREMIESFRKVAEQQKVMTELEDTYARQIQNVTNVNRAFNDATYSVSKFNNTMDSIVNLASGNIGGFRLQDRSERISSPGEFFDLDEFRRIVTDISIRNPLLRARMPGAETSIGERIGTEGIESAALLRDLPGIMLRFRESMNAFDAEQTLDQLMQEFDKRDYSDMVQNSIRRTLGDLGGGKRGGSIEKELSDNIQGVIEKIGEGLKPSLEVLAKLDKSLSDETNRRLNYVDQLNKLMNQEVDARLKAIDIQEKGAELIAKAGGPDVTSRSMRRRDMRRQRTILGGEMAGLAGDPRAMGIELERARNKLTEKQNKLADRRIDSEGKLTDEVGRQQEKVSRLTRALEFLTDVSGRTAATMKDVEKEQAKADFKKGLLEEAMTASGPSDFSEITSRLSMGLRAAKTGTMTSVPRDMRDAVVSLFKQIGPAELEIFGGKRSGEDILKGLMEDYASRPIRSGGLGLGKRDAKRLAEGTTSEMDRLRNQLKEIINDSASAQKVVIDSLGNAQNKLINKLNESITKFTNQLKTTLFEAQAADLKTELERVKGERQGVSRQMGRARGLGKEFGGIGRARTIAGVSGEIKDLTRLRKLETQGGVISSLMVGDSVSQKSSLTRGMDIYKGAGLEEFGGDEEDLGKVRNKLRDRFSELVGGNEELISAFETGMAKFGTKDPLWKTIKGGLDAARKKVESETKKMPDLYATLEAAGVKYEEIDMEKFRKYHRALEKFAEQDTISDLSGDFEDLSNEITNLKDQLRSLGPHPGRNPRRRAFGGSVPGVGSGDKVSALLEPGEFVLNRNAVNQIGSANLNKYNKEYSRFGNVGMQSGGGIDGGMSMYLEHTLSEEERKKAKERAEKSAARLEAQRQAYKESFARKEAEDKAHPQFDLSSKIRRRVEKKRKFADMDAYDEWLDNQISSPSDRPQLRTETKAPTSIGGISKELGLASLVGLRGAGASAMKYPDFIQTANIADEFTRRKVSMWMRSETPSMYKERTGKLSPHELEQIRPEDIKDSYWGPFSDDTWYGSMLQVPTRIGSLFHDTLTGALLAKPLGMAGKFIPKQVKAAAAKPFQTIGGKLSRKSSTIKPDPQRFGKQSKHFSSDNRSTKTFDNFQDYVDYIEEFGGQVYTQPKKITPWPKPVKSTPKQKTRQTFSQSGSRSKGWPAPKKDLGLPENVKRFTNMNDETWNQLRQEHRFQINERVSALRDAIMNRHVKGSTYSRSKEEAYTNLVKMFDDLRIDHSYLPEGGVKYAGNLTPGSASYSLGPDVINIPSHGGASSSKLFHEGMHSITSKLKLSKAQNKSLNKIIADWKKLAHEHYGQQPYSFKGKSQFKQYGNMAEYLSDPDEAIAYIMQYLPDEFASNPLVGGAHKIAKQMRGIMGFQKGALVPGLKGGSFIPGSGSGDKVPALLEPGEFVLNRNAVSQIGSENLNRYNKKYSRFQSGGQVQNQTVSPDLSALNDVVQKFANISNSIRDSIASINGLSIDLNARHDVYVTINGLSVMKQLEPSIQNLVVQETNRAINNMLKDKFNLPPMD